MRLTFTRDFDFVPVALKGTVTVAHKAGRTYTVNQECADQAVAAGVGAVEAENPPAAVETPAAKGKARGGENGRG